MEKTKRSYHFSAVNQKTLATRRGFCYTFLFVVPYWRITKAYVGEKIISLEAELNLLKSALTERPDFALDEVNWRKVKAIAKRERKKVWGRVYG